jgi:predicted Rossmann fold nucleotide-binding protein DprA/Smf involved in DNA uptake
VEYLLDRGVAMSLDTEKWMNKGIWVVCRSDETYPARLRAHLGKQAPPFLYATGNPVMLEGGGLAVIGSRNVEADGERYTRRVARRCAEHGVPVVSGGARGVDQAAMLEALDAEGPCIGILADSLARAAVDGKYRQHLREGRLLLLSPYRPNSGFSAGLAMGRNKLVYAMADAALVIQAERDKGGTWTGAKEEIRRGRSRPVFVRVDEPIPDGNQALLGLGAMPFPATFFDRPPLEILQDAVSPNASMKADATPTPVPEQDQSADTHSTDAIKSSVGTKVAEPAKAYPFATVLDAVRPLILEHLAEERTSEELSAALDVRKAQLDDWLTILVKEKAVKKLTRPVRYVRMQQLELGE